MSTVTRTPAEMVTVAAPSMIDRAIAIRLEVMNTDWPESGQAQDAIRWKLGELAEILAARDRLVNGEMDPYAVLAPDMGFWDDPEVQAREYLDDEALQAAEAARKRLHEGLRDEKNSSEGGTS